MNPQGVFAFSAGLVESAADPWGNTYPPLRLSGVAAPTILGDFSPLSNEPVGQGRARGWRVLSSPTRRPRPDLLVIGESLDRRAVAEVPRMHGAGTPHPRLW